MRSIWRFGALVLFVAGAARANIAYFNLPPAGPADPGEAANVEKADDLTLDLSGGATLRSAMLRIDGANVASGMARIRMNIYADGGGRPGSLLTTTVVDIPAGGPAHYEQLFDFPDVTVSSPTIWVGHVFEVLPSLPPFVGVGTLPTIGSTTPRAARSLGPGMWDIEGANGPAPGGGWYDGDRVQISIDAVPAPGVMGGILVGLAAAGVRRRR